VDIFSGAILVSILIYIVVGNYAGRGVKDLDDFFVAVSTGRPVKMQPE